MAVNYKNKKVGIFILIGFLLIIGIIIIYIYTSYNDDKAEIKKRMNVVIDNYDNFVTDVDKFNEERDNVYKEVMQNTYYDDLKNNDTKHKEILNNYKVSLEKIDDDYKKVEKSCINVLHPNTDVNSKCEAMVLGYEKVVNTYISDVKKYNSLIETYNKDSKNEKIEEIKVNRDYIDINGDREYAGKTQINKVEKK